MISWSRTLSVYKDFWYTYYKSIGHRQMFLLPADSADRADVVYTETLVDKRPRPPHLGPAGLISCWKNSAGAHGRVGMAPRPPVSAPRLAHNPWESVSQIWGLGLILLKGLWYSHSSILSAVGAVGR